MLDESEDAMANDAATAKDDGADRKVAERARELYWNSDQGVNAIANDLGLSKGRLYGLIEPLPSGRSCPVCGSDTVYDNRTAKDKDEPTCPVCTAVAQGKRPPPAPRSAAPHAPSSPTDPGSAREKSPRTRSRAPATADSAPIGDNTRVVAGLFLGAFAGLFLYRWMRNR